MFDIYTIFTPGRSSGTHCTGAWVGFGDGLDLIRGPSTLLRIAKYLYLTKNEVRWVIEYMFEDERGDLCYWFGSDNLESLGTLRWMYEINFLERGHFEERGNAKKIRERITRSGGCESVCRLVILSREYFFHFLNTPFICV
jgi:hypothetical protein